MVLRATLALIVASLGFEAPEGFNLVRAQRAGQAWYLAQKEQWTTWWERSSSGWAKPVGEDVAGRITTISMSEMPNGNTAFASNDTFLSISEPTQIPNGLLAFVSEPEADPSPDLVFTSLVSHMAADFANSELITPEPPLLDNAPVAIHGVERPHSSEIEHCPLLVLEEEGGVTTPQPELDVESRGERVATAIRLTGQAMHAWLSLIQVTGGLE